MSILNEKSEITLTVKEMIKLLGKLLPSSNPEELELAKKLQIQINFVAGEELFDISDSGNTEWSNVVK
jgi:hypothetical protein